MITVTASKTSSREPDLDGLWDERDNKMTDSRAANRRPLSSQDIHWLAGLLEGEGCFTVHGNKRWGHSHNPVVDLGMTDEDVVRRAQSLIGGNVYKMASRKLPIYRLRMTGAKAVAVMMTVYALMGARRQARIKGLIYGWKTWKPKRCGCQSPA